jgi:XTP/dITP diphosphohydrolase
MSASRRIVLASDNRGKLAEFNFLLAPLAAEVVAQGALGVAPAPEPHPTFVENALAKARHAAAATGLAALADDSGLCCRALAGAPGVRSARFGGAGTDDERNNAELLRVLDACGDRSAHYTCVLVAVRDAGDPEPLIAEGYWHGAIARAPAGTGGFGYDPLFVIDGRRTAAELEPAEKNRLSHRGRAARALIDLLKTRWGW